MNPGDPYQTVTIVPSQTNPGEVSYVLIVQQPDGKDKQDDQDLTVYDFDDHEEPVPQSAAVCYWSTLVKLFHNIYYFDKTLHLKFLLLLLF